MARPYKELPPLWYLQSRLVLSDRHPSGLEWRDTTGWHKEGDMAGKLSTPGNYYVIRMNGEQYHAHRIVYYLRTNENPGSADVKHHPSNVERDNRKQLSLTKRKAKNKRQPKITF